MIISASGRNPIPVSNLFSPLIVVLSVSPSFVIQPMITSYSAVVRMLIKPASLNAETNQDNSFLLLLLKKVGEGFVSTHGI